MEKLKGTNTINVDNLDKLKPGDGVQIGDTKYEYGAQLGTEGVPVIDPGEGKTVSIRTFTFEMNPIKYKNKEFLGINKQELFNTHARQLAHILWGDGLVPMEEVAPRVIINNKRGFYQIHIACQAKSGVVFMDKPKNLSEELRKEQKAKLDKATKNGSTRHTK